MSSGVSNDNRLMPTRWVNRMKVLMSNGKEDGSREMGWEEWKGEKGGGREMGGRREEEEKWEEEGRRKRNGREGVKRGERGKRDGRGGVEGEGRYGEESLYICLNMFFNNNHHMHSVKWTEEVFYEQAQGGTYSL